MKSATERPDAYMRTGHAAGWQSVAEVLARQVRNAACAFWANTRDRYEAYRRRMVAEVLYTELSKLSDADLELRGMARGDLYRLTREMAER